DGPLLVHPLHALLRRRCPGSGDPGGLPQQRRLRATARCGGAADTTADRAHPLVSGRLFRCLQPAGAAALVLSRLVAAAPVSPLGPVPLCVALGPAERD